MRKIIAVFLAMTMAFSMAMVVSASEVSDSVDEMVAFYNAEGKNYITEMPEALSRDYGDIIRIADQCILDLYGSDEMTSTSDDFVLDQYCSVIQMGVCLDITDEGLCERLQDFVYEAAKYYIQYNKGRSSTSEIPVTEATEYSAKPGIEPRLAAGNYNAKNAVAYAKEWTDPDEELTNPSYTRYDSDCTNFVSQALYAGGISQISGSRTDTAAWFYEWGLVAIPSYTWSGAQNLYDHLKSYSSNVTKVTSTADLEVGDILQFDTLPDDGTFHIGHTAIITKMEGTTWDKIYVTYHSTDREDYAVSNLVTKAGYIPYAWAIN